MLMKLLVLSDTHLQNELFKKITDKYPNMDYYVHCGDSSLEKEDPLLNKYYVVKGNHDNANFPLEIRFAAGNYHCLIVHGHYYDVYRGDQTLYDYMVDNNIDICFHGHTHVPSLSIINSKYIINPGSVMINRGSYGFGTYAIVTLDDHGVNVAYYNHETHEECTELVLNDGKIYLEEFKQLLDNYQTKNK